MRGQPLGEIERARPAGVVLAEMVELGLERRIALGLVPAALEVEDQRHQRLGHEAAAEHAEHALLVRSGPEGIRFDRLVHAVLLAWPLCCAIARRRPDGPEKRLDQRRLLDARRALDAGRNVDAGWVRQPQGFADIGRVEAPRKHVIDVSVKAGKQPPVERNAIAARQFASRQAAWRRTSAGRRRHGKGRPHRGRRRCGSTAPS